MFFQTGPPPQPVATRWAGWLNAAFCFAENFQAVKEIISKFEGTGILLTNAKKASLQESLSRDLTAIYSCYRDLVQLVEKISAS